MRERRWRVWRKREERIHACRVRASQMRDGEENTRGKRGRECRTGRELLRSLISMLHITLRVLWLRCDVYDCRFLVLALFLARLLLLWLREFLFGKSRGYTRKRVCIHLCELSYRQNDITVSVLSKMYQIKIPLQRKSLDSKLENQKIKNESRESRFAI